MRLRALLLITVLITTAYGGYSLYVPYAFRREDTAGRLMLANELYDSAAVHFRHAIALDPSQASVHDNLGTCLFMLGDRPGGIAEYRLSLQLDPWSAAAHFNLAQALFRDEQPTESLREAKAALRWVDPASNEAKRIEAFLADPARFMATAKHD